VTFHITDFPVGVGAFGPRSIGNLLSWHDSSDSSSCLTSTSPETPATNGQTVTRWKDKSGNGYHLDQGTGISQPTVVTGALNGRQVLNFDGSNDSMVTGFSYALASSKTMTVFVVGKSDLTTQAAWLAFHRTDQPDYSSCFSNLVVTSSTWLQMGIGDGGLAGSSYNVWTTSQTVNSYFIQATRMSTSAISHRRNGATSTLADGNGTMAIGSWMSLGAGSYRMVAGAREGDTNNTPDYFHDGQLAELIIYNAVLSDSDTAKVESYLSSKWGVAL
jgi:hypothetical protein